MKYLGKRITHGAELFCEPDIPAREEKIQQTIQTAMESLITAQSQEPMDVWEFLYCQNKYIKKHWWLLQVFLLVGLYAYVRTLHDTILIRQALGVGAPLFIILVIPELWKNQTYNALDIESVSMYTLRQLYSARLTLFAGADLLFLTTFCFGSAASHVLTVWEILTLFVLPVNVTCCICLTCLYSRRVNHQAFSLALCLAFGGVWKEIVGTESLYEVLTVPTWAGALLTSLGYIAYCVIHGQRNLRKNLEVRLIWSE